MPNREWLVIEIKLREQTLVSYGGKKRGQLNAILRYAANHQSMRVAAFVALTKGKNSGSVAIARRIISEAAAREHAMAVVVSLQSFKRYK
jgi:hypothetical protein